MKDLIKENYEITKARGLINDNTTAFEFIEKLTEEYNELVDAYQDFIKNPNKETNNIFNLELIDIKQVIQAYFYHLFSYETMIELEKEKIEINRKRI
jgi:translation elongation factor EF-Tu-like GTPase